MSASSAGVAKSKKDWIVDSGVNCYMCNDQSTITGMTKLGSTEKMRLGDMIEYSVNVSKN